MPIFNTILFLFYFSFLSAWGFSTKNEESHELVPLEISNNLLKGRIDFTYTPETCNISKSLHSQKTCPMAKEVIEIDYGTFQNLGFQKEPNSNCWVANTSYNFKNKPEHKKSKVAKNPYEPFEHKWVHIKLCQEDKDFHVELQFTHPNHTLIHPSGIPGRSESHFLKLSEKDKIQKIHADKEKIEIYAKSKLIYTNCYQSDGNSENKCKNKDEGFAEINIFTGKN